MVLPEDTQRRLVLQLGAGACTLPLLGALVSRRVAARPLAEDPAVASAAPAPIAVDALVVDARGPAAHTWLQAWQGKAARTHQIEGDVTALWRDGLDAATRTAPLCVAGITAAPALSCLELLTSDRRMTVALRIERRLPVDGIVEYAITVPRSALRAVASHMAAGGDTAKAVVRSMRLAAGASGPLEQATVRVRRQAVDAGLPGADRSDDPVTTAWLLRPLQSPAQA